MVLHFVLNCSKHSRRSCCSCNVQFLVRGFESEFEEVLFVVLASVGVWMGVILEAWEVTGGDMSGGVVRDGEIGSGFMV